MFLLPLAYLPSVRYFACLMQGGCVVDLGEHFIKRSERNRARILAADGTMELTVHVAHANRPRQPVRDVRLDYSKRWQHQHWGRWSLPTKGRPISISMPTDWPLLRAAFRFSRRFQPRAARMPLRRGADSHARGERNLCRSQAWRLRSAAQKRRRPGLCGRALRAGLRRPSAVRP